jgi:hypothetical protein
MMDSPIQNRIGCVFIPVSDMTRARRQIAVEIVRPIEDIGSVSTLVLKDPDDNLLMICQHNPDTTDIATR